MGDFLVYTIGFPITFLLLVLGMSLAARRILGLRVGLIRTALACLLAMSIAAGIFGETTTPTASLATIQLGLSLLVVIGLLAFAEIIVPTGSIPPPTEWWGMLRRRLKRTRRYSRITAIAFRHGLGPYLRGRERSSSGLARSLRLALQDAGVTFVKLGQVLSTRADLLPPDFVDELSLLQDKVPAAKWDQVRAVLDAEVGLDAFTSVDETPLAAASIAQVHRAVLKSGAEVVVKVQRPDVRSVAEGDLDIVSRLAETLQRTRWGSALGVRDLAAGFAAALREELDFRVEARNIAAVSAVADASVGLPHVHLSTSRVLVMDRLDGVPLRGATEDEGLARTLLRFVLRQVMLDGVFHADPHPGNVLLLSDGRLGLLDFGSVGRIDSALRSALQRLLLAIDRGDPAGLTDALLGAAARLSRRPAGGAGRRAVPGVRLQPADRVGAAGTAGGRRGVPAACLELPAIDRHVVTPHTERVRCRLDDRHLVEVAEDPPRPRNRLRARVGDRAEPARFDDRAHAVDLADGHRRVLPQVQCVPGADGIAGPQHAFDAHDQAVTVQLQVVVTASGRGTAGVCGTCRIEHPVAKKRHEVVTHVCLLRGTCATGGLSGASRWATITR